MIPQLEPSSPTTITPELLGLLHNSPPRDAQSLRVSPKIAGMSAWEYRGKIYLRTRYPAVFPAWLGVVNGDDMAASRKLLSIAEDEEFLPEYSLKQGYRDIIGFGRDEVFTTGMAKIINEATSYYTNCERDAWRSKENLIGVFRVPQRSHAYNVLNAALPYGDFVEVPQNELPGPKADRDVVQHWLATYGMNDGMPGLFKITWQMLQKDCAMTSCTARAVTMRTTL